MMRELALCLVDAEIEIGGTCYRVRIPKAREAILLYAALEAYRAGDGGAEAVVRRVCRAWLPARLFDRYFGSGSFAPASLSDIGDLLNVGIADRRQHERDRKTVEEAARSRSLFAVLADFSEAQATPAMAALEMPWPLFVGLCAEIVRQRAARRADFMLAYGAARSGDRALWQGAMERAGYAEEPGEAFEEPAWMDDEWEQRQIEKARRMGRHGEA